MRRPGLLIAVFAGALLTWVTFNTIVTESKGSRGLQEGDFPAYAELAFGSHVLHTVMFRRYALEPGAEHEFPALAVGPPWFAAEPVRQRLLCTEAGTRELRGTRLSSRRVEVRDPQGAVPAFAAWLDEHDVVLESYEDTHTDEPWMRLVEYGRGPARA